MSWIIGRSAGSTQPSLGRVSLSLHYYQNPQFGMTINKISPSPHPTSRKTIHWIVLLGRVTRGEGIKSPPRNHRFRSSRKGWTFCAFSLLFTTSAIRHAVSHGSYYGLQIKKIRSKPYLFYLRSKRFELPTFWFVAKRSIQLSYERIFFLHFLSYKKNRNISSIIFNFM